MIPYGRHHIEEDDIQAVVTCMRGTHLTQGPLVREFEQAIADYVGARYAVAVSSGTAALHLAMISAGVQCGDSVVTSPITFVASANSAKYVGANVLLADIDPETVNMSPVSLKSLLIDNPEVRAVVPVHFAGMACDMPVIKEISDSVGAVVIEDAAHALGARYQNGQHVGCCSHSLMTVFSFHPVKAIAAGEGGMITTNDENVYHSLLRLRSHGINKGDDEFLNMAAAETEGIENPWYYEMQELGFNYRITDIQCALGLSQLGKLDRFILKRRELAKRYDEILAEFRFLNCIQSDGRDISAHHLYPVLIDFSSLQINRAQLMRDLRSEGVIAQVHYIPVPVHPYYRQQGFELGEYPSSQAYYEQTLSIPLFYDLTEKQQDFVVRLLNKYLV